MTLPDPPRALPAVTRRRLDEVRKERDDARNLAYELAALWLGIELADQRDEKTELQRVRLSALARTLMMREWD